MARAGSNADSGAAIASPFPAAKPGATGAARLLHQAAAVMKEHPQRFLLFTQLLAALLAMCTTACSSSDGGEPDSPPSGSEERLVEEGDIVRLDGNTMFVLNRWRGLLIVALDDPTAPKVAGAIPYRGDPLELYARNGYVMAVLRAPVDADLCPTCQGSPSRDSLLLVVNVKDVTAPHLVAKVALEGHVSHTRFVGDVFYAVADDGRLVHSVDLRDPDRPRTVDRLELDVGNYQTQVLVTDRIFYIAAAQDRGGEPFGECGDSYGGSACTLITAIDVSSPTGDLRLGVRYPLSGYLMSRWALDHHEGILRLMVRPSEWRGSKKPAVLRTFRASSAYELEALATLPLLTDRPEQLTAVRFDGARAFAVTFERIDPLFTIDLQDPAQPKLMGHLETPGWLDFIVPRGDRLIAVGRDREHDGAPWKMHVSLYDVGNLAAPRLLARVLFGEGMEGLADQPDQLAKVVRVVDELGLVLVPIHARRTDVTDPWFVGGQLQLFHFTRDTLERAGDVVHAGLILRALPLAGGKIVTVSNEAVEVLDVSQPAVPKLVGQLHLARKVVDAVLRQDHGLVLWENAATGRNMLSLLPAGTTDLRSATSTVDLGAADRLFATGSGVFAVSTGRYVPATATVVTVGPQQTLVAGASFSDISHSSFGAGPVWGAPPPATAMPIGTAHVAFVGPGAGSETARLTVIGETRVAGQLEWPKSATPWILGTHGGLLVVSGHDSRASFERTLSTVAFIDVSDPAAPRLVAQTRVEGVPLFAHDGLLFSEVERLLTVSQIGPAGTITEALKLNGLHPPFTVAMDGSQAAVRSASYLHLLDFAVPAAPRELARVIQPQGTNVRALVRGHAFLDGAVYDLRGGKPALKAPLPSSLPFVTIRTLATPSGDQAYFAGGFYGVHVLALD